MLTKLRALHTNSNSNPESPLLWSLPIRSNIFRVSVDEKTDHAILTLAASSGPKGLAMGTIVDRLVTDGYEEAALELRIWFLLNSGQLRPMGFIRRIYKVGDAARGPIRRRGYELMLSGESP